MTYMYRETPLIRTVMGLEESVLIRGVLIGGVDLDLNNFQIIDDLQMLLLCSNVTLIAIPCTAMKRQLLILKFHIDRV